MRNPICRLFRDLLTRRVGQYPTRVGKPRLLRRRLNFEFLEDRLAPAVFNVNSLADIFNPPAGLVTLRSAIQAANTTPGDNTINLTLPGTYKITIAGSGEDSNATGDFDILGKAGGGNLTIQNTSNGKVVVDGNHLDRVFDINPTQLFRANLDGSQEAPSTGSTATGTANVLINSGQQTITFSGSFNGLQGQPTALDVHEAPPGFTGPAATDANGNNIELTDLPHAVSGSAGPQMFSINGAFLDQLKAGRFYANLVTTAFSSGEIRGQFAAISQPFTVTMSGFTITGGTTPVAEFGPGSGGGIEVQGDANLTLNNMVVTGNVANDDGGGIAMWDVNNHSWTLILNNSTISNNTATSDAGGGIFSNGTGTIAITAGSVIAGNFAYNKGGGIWLDSIGPASATLTIDGTLVSSNQAFSTTGIGGGIANDGNGIVMISSSAIQSNSAGLMGGGFDDAQGLGSLMIVNSVFRKNTAVGNGGGIATSGPATSIMNSEIDGNMSGGSGGGLFANGAALTIQSSTFATNGANGNGGGIELDTTGTGSTITDTTLTGNTAKNSGGGLDAGTTFSGSVTLLSDTINANSATAGGGVFWAAAVGSKITAENTIVAKNLASAGPDASATTGFSDGGGNLIGVSGPGSGNTGFTNSNTQTGILAKPLDPLLGPLGNNGGPTIGAPGQTMILQTEAPMTGSPAVGKGILTGAPVSDERGSPSVTNGKINVGAISLVPMASASITGKMIQATEGQLFQGQVATLQVSGAGANDTFTATIDWGDQSVPNAGTFTGSNGSYTINGSHTYADEGPYTIIIKAARTASPTSVIASGTSMASVAEGDKLSGKVTPGLTAAGLQFSGTVATFTDSDTASPATDFMATISWGDKTTSPGTVSASNGSFTVAGSHSYSGTGSLPIGVTLTEKTPGSATTTANGSLAVTSSSPRETIGDVLDSLTALKATATGDNAHRLARAIHKLTAALGSSLWINDSHLSPEDGETVFDRVKDATQRLFELYKDEHSNLPKDALLSNLMKLAQATEELASIAIMEASAEDENEHELDEAKNELARGISAWNAGQFDSVIDHFKNAWQDAEHVLRD